MFAFGLVGRPGSVVTGAPVRPPALNVMVPSFAAGPTYWMFVRTWNALGLFAKTPIAFGAPPGRLNTAGGTVIFFGSGPAVCLTRAFDLFAFTGISSGGNIVPVPIGLIIVPPVVA